MAVMMKGSPHVASVPITVMPSGLACEAELWLTSDGGATKAATSGLVGFTSTGAGQTVSFAVVMPTDWGEFEAYIDVYAEGMLIGAFVAAEHVVVPDVGFGPPVWE